jgi:SPP1 family predicted phage head-tail adaptor
VLSAPGASAPGRLRQRLALEKPTPVPDGQGGCVLTWDAVANVFAEVTPLRADERSVGEGLGDIVTHRVVIRHRADVFPGDRFALGTRVFRIRGMSDPNEDGRYLVCLCEEEGRP